MKYLDPDFEPKRAKIAYLRRVLVENHVEFASNLKKKELIKIFEVSIRPKLDILRSEHFGVEPSGKNIEIARVKRSTNADSKISKKSTTEVSKNANNLVHRLEQDIGLANMAVSTAVDVLATNETDVSVKSSPSNRKRNIATANSDVDKIEPDSFKFKKAKKNQSLTVNNKAAAVDSAAKQNQYQNCDTTLKDKKQKIAEDIVTATLQRKTLENKQLPVTVPNDEVVKSSEQSSNLTELSIKPANLPEIAVDDVDLKSANANTAFSKGKINHLKYLVSILKDSFIFIGILTIVCLTLWYREQRILIGFCDNEIHTDGYFDLIFKNQNNNAFVLKLKDIVDAARPQCIPCPSVSSCSSLMSSYCHEGYIPQRHILELGGLIPIPLKCVPDDSNEKIINKIVINTINILKKQNRAIGCGKSKNNTLAGLSEKYLYASALKDKSPWINELKFKKYWRKALIKILDYGEIEKSTSDQLSNTTFNSSHDNNYLRFSSKYRSAPLCDLMNKAEKNLTLFAVWILSCSFAYILFRVLRSKIISSLAYRSKVKLSTSLLLDRLRRTKESGNSPTFLTSGQLKNEVFKILKKENLEMQNKLWSSISKILMNTSKVQNRQVDIHGEIVRCWEWIGDGI